LILIPRDFKPQKKRRRSDRVPFGLEIMQASRYQLGRFRQLNTWFAFTS
jgi:hypothetical protein